jgi:UDP-N-acetylglucosamine acyltransferase
VSDQVVAQADFSAVEVDSGQMTARATPADGGGAAVRVHPTAVVAPTAELDHGVQIDAHAWVGPRVRLGRDTHVMHHASVDGGTVAGAGNRIFPYAQLGCLPQDKKYQGEEGRLTLGDRNLVREFATLSIGTEGGGLETAVGSENLFMNYSHVGHDCRIGDHVILANGVPLAGHVTIEDFAILSGLAAVAQFVRVGESAFVGGGSMVVMDVPPFCMANGDRAKLKGLNLVGLERRGLGAEEIQALKRSYRLLFQSKLLAAEAVARVRAELADSPRCLQLAAFVEASERGVTRP